MNVRLVAPPTGRSVANTLLTVGTAALTVTQAPVVLVPPPAALLAMAAVMLAVADIAVLPFVLVACGQTPTVGVALLVTGTIMVHVVAGLMIWRLVTVMTLLPVVAVTVPIEQVPVTAPPDATIPAGKVSVKLNVWVGFVAGWVTVKVRFIVAPTVKAALNTLLTVGAACVTVKLAAAVFPFNGPVAETIPDVLL